MNRFRANPRNIQIAKYNKLSPVVVAIVDRLERDQSHDPCLVALAIGALLDYNIDPREPFIKIDALLELAQNVGKQQAIGVTVPHMKSILSFGAVVPTWMVINKTSEADMDNARGKILTMLRSQKPSVTEMINLIHRIIDLAREYQNSHETLDRNQMMDFYRVTEEDPAWPEYTNIQKAQLGLISAHWFPVELIQEQAQQDPRGRVRELIEFTQDATNVDDLVQHVTITEELLNNVWPQLEDDQILALCEMRSGIDNRKVKIREAASVLLYMTLLCKNNVPTEQWYHNHIERLENDTGLTGLETEIPYEMLQSFVNIYNKQNLAADDIYKMLWGSAQLFHEAGIRSLEWCIEQSAASNISVATAVAEMVVKLKGLSINMLMNIIDMSEFKALAQLTAHILHDSFSPIVNPPVEMNKYGDLGYIGVVMSFLDGNPNARGPAASYKGAPLKFAKLPRMQLDKLIELIKEATSTYVDYLVDTESILKRTLGNVQIETFGEETYIIPNNMDYVPPTFAQAQERFILAGVNPAAPQEGAVGGNVAGEAFISVPRVPNEPEAQDAMRARRGFPRQFNNRFPLNTIKITTSELTEKMLFIETPKAKAFRILMGELYEASAQTRMNIPQDQRINPEQRKQRLSARVIAELTRLDVDILPEWNRDPDVIVPINPEEHRGHNYVMHYRMNPNRDHRGNVFLEFFNAGDGGALGNLGPLYAAVVPAPVNFMHTDWDQGDLFNLDDAMTRRLIPTNDRRYLMPGYRAPLPSLENRLRELYKRGVAFEPGKIVERVAVERILGGNQTIEVPAVWNLEAFAYIPNHWMNNVELGVVNTLVSSFNRLLNLNQHKANVRNFRVFLYMVLDDPTRNAINTKPFSVASTANDLQEIWPNMVSLPTSAPLFIAPAPADA